MTKTNSCKNCNANIPYFKRYCTDCARKKLNDYQKIYRENNRLLCQQRSRKSQGKKQEYYRLKRREYYRKIHGIPLDDPFVKRKNGQGNIDAQGYKTITVRGHPNQMDAKGRIREHVYVMSNYLGRPLRKGETVHHKNGIRDDNRIENLELWNRSQPAGSRVEDKIKWAIEFLTADGYKVSKE